MTLWSRDLMSRAVEGRQPLKSPVSDADLICGWIHSGKDVVVGVSCRVAGQVPCCKWQAIHSLLKMT